MYTVWHFRTQRTKLRQVFRLFSLLQTRLLRRTSGKRPLWIDAFCGVSLKELLLTSQLDLCLTLIFLRGLLELPQWQGRSN